MFGPFFPRLVRRRVLYLNTSTERTRFTRNRLLLDAGHIAAATRKISAAHCNTCSDFWRHVWTVFCALVRRRVLYLNTSTERTRFTRNLLLDASHIAAATEKISAAHCNTCSDSWRHVWTVFSASCAASRAVPQYIY